MIYWPHKRVAASMQLLHSTWFIPSHIVRLKNTCFTIKQKKIAGKFA